MDAFYERRPEELTVNESDILDFPAHFHESLELFYAQTAGTTVLAGEHSRDMQPGDLALIFPNRVHAYRCNNPQQPQNRAQLLIVPLQLTGEYRQILSEMVPENPFLESRRLHPDIVYAFSSFARKESHANPRASRALIQLILSRALPELSLHRSSGEQSLVFRIVEYLCGRYREPVTLDQLAKALGVSRYTVSRIFSEKIGCGFPEYLNRLRLGEAESLLASTQASITEISFRCGFETPRTFNRAFSKRHGITPREYRIQQKSASK